MAASSLFDRTEALRSPVSDPPAGADDDAGRGVLVGTAVMVPAAAAVFVAVHRSLVDDAYLTLDYARSLAFHLTWGLIPGHTANSATSPLHVLLLAALTVPTRDPVLALGLLFVAASALTGYWLSITARALRLPVGTGLVAALVLLVNPVLMSSIGLESALGVALLSGLLAAAVTGQPIRFGVLAGLLVLTRLDLVIFVAPLLVFGRPVRRRWWAAGAAAVACALPWFVVSWFALGSAVPDTLLIKIAQRAWGGYSFGTGLALLGHAYPVAVALSLCAPGLGLLVLLAWLPVALAGRARRLAGPVVLGLAAVLYFAVYSLLGVPPYHWYYAPPIAGLSVLAVFALGLVADRLRAAAGGGVAGSGSSAWRVGVVAVVVLVLGLVAGPVGWASRGGVPWPEAPVTTNWASAAQYARIGLDLRRRAPGRTLAAPGEIGTIAYYCDCAMVDVFADRALVVPVIDDGRARLGPLGRALLDLNFRHLDRGRAALPVDLRLRAGPAGPPGPASGSGPVPPGAWPIGSSWRGGSYIELLPGAGVR